MSSAQTIDFDWADYQADTRDALEAADHDLVVLRTGYGGGKSITGGQWIHRGALVDRAGDGKSLVMAQDYAKGKSTTYSVLFETLPGDNTNPFDDGDPENSPIVSSWHQNDKRLTYITGHTTFLGGADKWSRFAGAEFCRIWCDEVAHYETTDLYRLHEMLTTRQRTDIGPNTTLWTSTGNGFNQFYDITERQVNKEDDKLRWRDRMTVIEASTEDNPFLPDDGLEKIKAQFEGTEREEQGLHGGFAAAEGLVYSQFSRQTHVVDSDAVDELVADSAKPIYGYDAGWDHPRVLIQAYPTHHDQWLVTNCYYKSEREFEHLCDPDDAEGYVYEHDLPRGNLYAEHEPEHIQKFRRAGFDAVKAEKSLDEGIPHVRGRLKTDDKSRPGLLVSENCMDLIQEFQSYKEEHVGSSGDVPDHCLDALRYALFTDAQKPDKTVRRRSGSAPTTGNLQ
jgi:hypothetical protein